MHIAGRKPKPEKIEVAASVLLTPTDKKRFIKMMKDIGETHKGVYVRNIVLDLIAKHEAKRSRARG